MRTQIIAFVGLLAFLGYPVELLAQAEDVACEEAFTAPLEKQTCEASDMLRDAAFVRTDPSMTSPSRTNKRSAALIATQDKTTAAIELQLLNRKQKILSLKVAGAIDDNASEASLVDLDGLVGKTSVALGFHWKFGLDQRLEALETGPVNISEFTWCLLVRAKLHEEGLAHASLTCQELNAMFERATAKDPARRSPLEASVAKLDAVSSNDIASDNKYYLSLKRALALDKPLWAFDLEAAYSPEQTFEFVTLESLESSSEKHDGYSVTIGANILPGNKRSLWGLSYRIEESYSTNSKKQICSPFGSIDAALSCSEMVVGAPKLKRKQAATLEFRHYFRRGSGTNEWALAPRVSHDWENDVTGLQLPFWVLTDGAGNLSGGVSLGWDSENEDVTLTAFVGTLKNPFKKSEG